MSGNRRQTNCLKSGPVLISNVHCIYSKIREASYLNSWRYNILSWIVLSWPEIIFTFFERNPLQLGHEVLEDHLGLEDVLGEPDHAATGDGGRCCVLQVMNLKHDTHVGRKGQALTVGKSLQEEKNMLRNLGKKTDMYVQWNAKIRLITVECRNPNIWNPNYVEIRTIDRWVIRRLDFGHLGPFER